VEHLVNALGMRPDSMYRACWLHDHPPAESTSTGPARLDWYGLDQNTFITAHLLNAVAALGGSKKPVINMPATKPPEPSPKEDPLGWLFAI